MNYEKKHKEEIVRATRLWECGDITRENLEYIFPELKESEDECVEKIKKDIISYLNNRQITSIAESSATEKWLAWLEKQGKRDARYKYVEELLEADAIYQMAMNDAMVEEAKNKAIGALSELEISKLLGLEKQGEQNTVKPKFHEGDWVVDNHGEVNQVTSVTDDGYGFALYDGTYVSSCWKDYYHLWNIQDAKDGDLIYVSTEEKGIQAIFDKFDNGIIYFHCSLCSDFTQGGYMPMGDVEMVYPLQKTHYQRFFQKMEDAGYEWDDKKKELKKIEYQPSWSEEDEHRAKDTIYFLDTAKKHYASTVELDACIDWLKKLKERVQPQPKQEWKEDDEKLFNRIEGWLDTLCDYLKDSSTECIEDIKDIVEQFKALKQKYTWKPSDE